MLNIAICDDNLDELSRITIFMNAYINLQNNKSALKYTTFQNALDLIAAVENGETYELIILDIIMPYMTGMDAAKEIRIFNHDIKIIFLSSSTEFAIESYSVDAFSYVLKPIRKETLFELLDKVISKIDTQVKKSILIKGKNTLTRIPLHQLEYAEINARILLYHLVDGSIIEANGSMTELEKLLSNDDRFIKPHRSFIVNMTHITGFSQRVITMHSTALVPMAKANYATLKSLYIANAFKEQETF